MLNSISHAFCIILQHFTSCTSKRSEATKYSTQTPEGWWDLIRYNANQRTICEVKEGNKPLGLSVCILDFRKELHPTVQSSKSRVCSKTFYGASKTFVLFYPSKGWCEKASEFKKNRDSPSLHPCPLARLTPLRWTVDESHLLPWFCHRPGGRGPLCGPKAPFYFIQLSSACSQWHNARTRQFFSPYEHASSNLHKAWYVLMLYPCLKHIALHLLLHSQVAASQRPTWKGHFASTTCHGHPSRAPKQTRCIPWPYSYHWPCPFSQ